MKTCCKCKERKDIEDFAINRSRPDGRQGWCRKCATAHTLRMRNDEHFHIDTVNKQIKAAKYKDAPRVRKHGQWIRMLLPYEIREWAQRLRYVTTGIQPEKPKGRRAVV